MGVKSRRKWIRRAVQRKYLGRATVFRKDPGMLHLQSGDHLWYRVLLQRLGLVARLAPKVRPRVPTLRAGVSAK